MWIDFIIVIESGSMRTVQLDWSIEAYKGTCNYRSQGRASESLRGWMNGRLVTRRLRKGEFPLHYSASLFAVKNNRRVNYIALRLIII